nr:molybdopterin-dependent oxidoreductase [Lentibacillus saliphilus]
MSRRKFIKALGAFGAVAAVGPAFIGPIKQVFNGVWYDEGHGVGTDYQDYGAEDVIFSTCEQCNTYCTIKAYITSGKKEGPYSTVIRKLAGNQYSPLNMVPFGAIAYATPIDEAVKGNGDVKRGGRGARGGRICLKGQAGIQTAYDPYRVKHPLKRVGPRGSGKWKVISWEEAYDEIVEGSKDLGTPGLKELSAYVPEEGVMADWEKVKKGTMTQAAFDQKYKDVLVDTKHPDFGPKVNQVTFMVGDRRDFVQRFISNSLGSKNYYHHGGVCGISSVIGNVRSYSGQKKKKRQYADIDNTLFLLVWGTNPMVANKGPTWLAPKITNAIQNGMQMAVVDPRFSKTAEKAQIWAPIKPGTDAALALAIGRTIIEKNWYDEIYLTNPNGKAAAQDNEPTWSDATHLVNLSDPKRPKLRASDLGIGTEEQFVVIENGQPVPHDQAMEGELEVDKTIKGFKVKSSFQLYKERTMEKTIDEYSAITTIPKAQIKQIAKQFTSYGKRASILSYRGPAMHVNGYYTQRLIASLNHLIGSYDWKGGNITTGAFYQEFAGKYDLNTVPNGKKPWGIPTGRNGVKYESTSLFEKDGYPAKRPWFPYSPQTVGDVLPSALHQYPYPIKALITHRMSPVLSAPNGQIQEQVLKDPDLLPLFVASDVQIGDSSKYADFILPDTVYLERWGREAIYPNITTKLASVYQPVTRVFPNVRSFENSIIELAKRMGLPGYGENAFADGSSLDIEEDYYIKRVANIAYDGTPVPDANARELEVFSRARKKALGNYFDEQRWKQAVKPEEWKKVVYVLNRGGRFEEAGNEYVNNNHIKYSFGGQANFYDEGVAAGKNSYDGQFFEGMPFYEEIKSFNRKPIQPKQPLQFINWKARNMGTYRNVSSAWLREVRADNYIWMNKVDANRRGIKTGDTVRISNESITLEGTVYVTAGIAPGVVGSAYNMGQKGYGVERHTIDGQKQKSLPTYNHTSFKFKKPMHEDDGYPGGRGEGFPVNKLTELDSALKDGAIYDEIGGAPGQLDMFVDIKKV